MTLTIENTFSIHADDGGFRAKFKHPKIHPQCGVWDTDEDAARQKANRVCEFAETSEHLDKRWNSVYGGVVSVLFYSLPTLGEGSELYEVKHQDGTIFRIDGRHMADTIAKNIDAATPEGQAAAKEKHERYEKEREKMAKAKAAEEAWRNRLHATIYFWLDGSGYAKINAGKAREVLMTPIHYLSLKKTMTRLEYVIQALYDGDKPASRTENKVKEKTRRQYNRMDNDEQREHEQRIKEAGTKTVYSLESTKDNTFMDITKAEYDYACFRMKKLLHFSVADIQKRDWERTVQRFGKKPSVGWIDHSSSSWDRRCSDARAMRLHCRLRGIRLTYNQCLHKFDELDPMGWVL